eukprot:6213578-Pleurochrysis_carterae.AAC.4
MHYKAQQILLNGKPKQSEEKKSGKQVESTSKGERWNTGKQENSRENRAETKWGRQGTAGDEVKSTSS